MVAAARQGDAGSEDFSPAATIVPFDPPLPLLRGPVPAGPADDPLAGPFVLAFKDAASWKSAFQATKAQLIEQCESGARVGCSVSASNKCKPPWWRSLFGFTAADFAEREQCEEREMSLCLAASKEACLQFAKDKCIAPFRDARIACISWEEIPLAFASNKHEDSKTLTLPGGHSSRSSGYNPEVTNYRGSVLMDKHASTPEL